jgi:hypothetical protein
MRPEGFQMAELRSQIFNTYQELRKIQDLIAGSAGVLAC